MTCIIKTASSNRFPARLAAGIAFSALFVLGTTIASASAEETETTIETHSEFYVSPGVVVAPPMVVAPPVIVAQPPPMVVAPPVVLEPPPPPMIIMH